MKHIEDYTEIVGEEKIKELKELAEPLQDKHIVNVSSAFAGGGVAEMLNSFVVLMNDLGIDTGWRLMIGDQIFFDVTKKFHNALQGEEIHFTERKKEIYLENNKRNAFISHFEEHDCVFIHDPQPLAMINFSPKQEPWVWRCHIDYSQPATDVEDFLKQFMKKYDQVIISNPKHQKKHFQKTKIIYPAIDPLSAKNESLNEEEVVKILAKNNIPLDHPLLVQVSRFDKWKDPLGVIKIYKRIREQISAHLVLIGSMASDDPEGPDMYAKIKEETKGDPEITVISKRDDYLVNALQTKADVVIQNSKKEGFGLTVTEALWKKTPVCARNTSGPALQIDNGECGFLYNDESEAVEKISRLLENKELREKMGKKGHKKVKANYLVTENIKKYLILLNKILA